MTNCKMAEFLFAFIPLKIWQDFLIRRHMQDCPRCQEKLANRDEIIELVIREEHIKDAESLWTDIESKLKTKQSKEKAVHSSQQRWAYGAAITFVIVAGIFVVSNISHWRNNRVEEISSDHFQINYIRIEGEPAQAYLFKPQGTDMIIVWAQKNMTGERE